MAEEPVASAQSKAAPLGGSMIPTVNKLQDIFAQLGGQSVIELPQVAVVGSQSSGKSSVLENMVGRDFLPRGTDICTRRPLMLQLVQTKKKTDGPEEEYGEFLHLPGRKFYDFSQIRREIEIETDKEAGGNKGVSDKPIRLKITSPNVLDITLVDLPGITKVPVGDQPSDIEAQIRSMIMNYIENDNCLIIAVTPANSDLANSDALKIAKKADPEGTRTIGVITKLDIMDRGTDARNFLLGKVIPLRLGYVGVVNRCQEDIMLNRSIKDALVAEENFFRSRPVYSDLADRCGIPQLARKLNQVLVQHIKTLLPGLKARINAALVSVAKEHASYGETPQSKGGQGSVLLNILSKYSEALSSMIEGKGEELSTTELSGGARIHYIFQSIFVKSLEEVDPCEDLTDDDIRTAIQNATGTKFSLFVPEVPFEVLVRKQIARLLDPSLQCARFIYDELMKMSHQCMVNELQRFPVLRRSMDEVVGNFLREGLEPSETMIGHIIEMEMDYINTSHSKFIGGSKANEIALQQIKANRVVSPVPTAKDATDQDRTQSTTSRSILSRPINGVTTDRGVLPGVEAERPSSSGVTTGLGWALNSIFRGPSNRASSRQNSTSRNDLEPVYSMEHDFTMIHLREPPAILRPSEVNSEQVTLSIAVTKLLLRSYYDIVRKNVEDAVPKAIMHFLVNHTKRELHNVFIQKLYRENLFEDLLREPSEMAMKRERAEVTFRVLQEASKTLDELPLEADGFERGHSSGTDPTGLPKINGLPASSSRYMTSNGSTESYNTASARNHKSRSSSHSGEL